MDDVELWAASLALDARAFRALYDRHRARVFSHSLRLVAQAAEADDVTAAVFLELWRRRAVVPIVDGSVLPWLLATATNLSRNRLRARWRYGRLLRSLPRDPEPDAEAVATASLLRDEQRRALQGVFAGLGDRDAALVALTALDGMTTAAAARAVGLSPGAARTRLSRVKARLRESLADLMEEPL